MIKIGIIDYIFKNRNKKIVGEYFKMLNGYSPVFTSYDGGIYEMDLTRSAINNFAIHCSKLAPEVSGDEAERVKKIFINGPNMFMDTTKFISMIATILECEHTVFILPVTDDYGYIYGYYPVRPTMCEVIQYKGEPYLRYTFGNGERAAIELVKVGIMTSHQYKNDLFGEDNNTMNPTMQLIHTSNEGIINAVKNSASIRFMGKISNFIKNEDIEKERNKFVEQNLSSSNKSGMILFDNRYSDIKQIDSKPYTPNAMQMTQIQENVFMHFNTNMDILQNKFDEEKWNAYYEGKIEPFAIQLSTVLSKMTFTDKELEEGNMITFSTNRLQYASNSTKLQVSTQLFDRGLINRNSVMDIWNMPHVEGGDKYYIRREYTEVSKLDDNKDVFSSKKIKEGE